MCALIQCTEVRPYIVERVVCGHLWSTPIGSDSSPLHRHSIPGKWDVSPW